MGWNTPRTWEDEELVTAAMLNEQLRDNLNALKTPPSDNYEPDESTDYATTSTTFEDVDATLSLTITTNGGDVLVHFHGFLEPSTSRVFLDVDVDGTRVAGDDGITRSGTSGETYPMSFTRLITGLSAGEHTFKLQWKVSAGSCTLYAGAGTSSKDLHPQFWVREVS